VSTARAVLVTVYVGWIFLDHADGDDSAVHRYIPGGARSSSALGGEATQAGDVAGGDGSAHGQPPRHGRHRGHSHGETGRAAHPAAAAAAATAATASDATTTGDERIDVAANAAHWTTG